MHATWTRASLAEGGVAVDGIFSTSGWNWGSLTPSFPARVRVGDEGATCLDVRVCEHAYFGCRPTVEICGRPDPDWRTGYAVHLGRSNSSGRFTLGSTNTTFIQRWVLD